MVVWVWMWVVVVGLGVGRRRQRTECRIMGGRLTGNVHVTVVGLQRLLVLVLLLMVCASS
jgi:hypothetical protein